MQTLTLIEPDIIPIILYLICGSIPPDWNVNISYIFLHLEKCIELSRS